MTQISGCSVVMFLSLNNIRITNCIGRGCDGIRETQQTNRGLSRLL